MLDAAATAAAVAASAAVATVASAVAINVAAVAAQAVPAAARSPRVLGGSCCRFLRAGSSGSGGGGGGGGCSSGGPHLTPRNITLSVSALALAHITLVARCRRLLQGDVHRTTSTN